MNEDVRDAKQPEATTKKSSSVNAGAVSPEELNKKLRFSRILNLVLVGLLVFVGGSYAALLIQKTDDSAVAMAPETEGPGAEALPEVTEMPDQPPMPQVIRADADDYMALGDLDAPVTFVEWTDFTCPYCGVFNRETLPTLIEDYIDTGKVRLEVNDVTFIGPEAEDAAVAARAAGLQDKYFDYLFAIYDLAADDNKPDLSKESLFAVAKQVGVDLKKFEADFDGDELRSQVQESTAFAQSIGVTSVPFFAGTNDGTLDNSEAIAGAQPTEQFKQYLDQLIADAE